MMHFFEPGGLSECDWITQEVFNNYRQGEIEPEHVEQFKQEIDELLTHPKGLLMHPSYKPYDFMIGEGREEFERHEIVAMSKEEPLMRMSLGLLHHYLGMADNYIVLYRFASSTPDKEEPHFIVGIAPSGIVDTYYRKMVIDNLLKTL